MNSRGFTSGLAVLAIAACAAPYDPLEDYEGLEAATVLEAPAVRPGSVAPAGRDLAARGRYLVELLGCGACHTDGALEGNPDRSRALAGSRTGIAYTNPLEHKHPGVVYPSNLTPDPATGIGRLSDRQIAAAIRAGIGRHGDRLIAVMPWQGYAKLSTEDVTAIVAYLRSIEPVSHRVPAAVPPGTPARYPYVHFGIYRKR